MNTLIEPDALIFDMDGTLWDAIGTYAESFNHYFAANNIKRHYTRADLEKYMGWEQDLFLKEILPELSCAERLTFYQSVIELQYQRIQKKGGKLYEGVQEGIAQLAAHYRLFIVSNCPELTIHYFMDWAGIKPYIADSVAYGETFKPKHENIRHIIDKHQLKKPVYIGDTQADATQSQLVPLPFVFVDYGFGYTEQYAQVFSSFGALTSFYLGLKNELIT